jgi:acetyl-CoA acetyltransferase
MGITSETVAARYGVSREQQDALAAASHDKALRAQQEGRFARELVPVVLPNGQVVTVDEGPRAGTTKEALAKLKPAFSGALVCVCVCA